LALLEVADGVSGVWARLNVANQNDDKVVVKSDTHPMVQSEFEESGLQTESKREDHQNEKVALKSYLLEDSQGSSSLEP
jgi:hypothetical protein